MLSTRRRFYTSDAGYGNVPIHRNLSTPREHTNQVSRIWKDQSSSSLVNKNDTKETNHLSLLRGSYRELNRMDLEDSLTEHSTLYNNLNSSNQANNANSFHLKQLNWRQRSDSNQLGLVSRSLYPSQTCENEKTLQGSSAFLPLQDYNRETSADPLERPTTLLQTANQASFRSICSVPTLQSRAVHHLNPSHEREFNSGCPKWRLADSQMSLKSPLHNACVHDSSNIPDTGFDEEEDSQLCCNDTKCQEHFMDSLTVKYTIDYCLKQDETLLQLDSFISSVPIGSYTVVSKIFTLTESLSIKSSTSCSQEQLDSESSKPFSLPYSLKVVLTNYKKAENFPLKPGTVPLFSFIPDLDVLCYTATASNTSCHSMLYLWKWTSSKNPLELSFRDAITAIGFVNPAYFFFCHEYKNENIDSLYNVSPPSKLLLVSTISMLSLWAIYEHSDVCSPILRVVETPYRCSSRKVYVTSIVGHNESGRLFFGDANGGVHEFVFAPIHANNESWISFLYRLTPWSLSSKPNTLTVSENVSSLSFLRRVFGGFLGGSHAIVELSMDGQRGLLYALDMASNIQVFFLPPPDVSFDNGVIEYPLQPIATLSHSTILSEMKNIYREVLRVTHHYKRGDFGKPERDVYPDDIVETAIRTNRIVHILPTRLDEGDSVIALALCADGTRLYLCARSELPLLPKKIERTSLPNICEFEYIKSLYVVNWKLPLTNISTQGHSSTCFSLPQTSISFYSQKTFLCSYHQADNTSLLMCVTLDEANLLSRRTSAAEDVSNGGNQFMEWCQICCLPDCEVLGIYEQAIPSFYQNLLIGDGSLPNPYDVLSRMYDEQFQELVEREADETTPNGSLPLSNHASKENTATETGCLTNPGNSWNFRYTSRLKPKTFFGNQHQTLSFCHATNTQRVVPPVSLHNWIATQTVPARMFTVLTNKGIFQLQQNRFYDILKNTASEYIEKSLAGHVSLSKNSGDVTEFFCAYVPKEDLYHLTPQYLLSSKDGLNSKERSYFFNNALLNQFSNYSLLNIYCVCQLMALEQAMSFAWQMLTFNAGSSYWEAAQTPPHDAFKFRAVRTMNSKYSPCTESTPFALALRSSHQHSSTEPIKDNHLPLQNRESSFTRFTPGTTYQFPLPLIQHALLSWLTNASVHSSPLFREGLPSTFHNLGRLTLPYPLDSQSFLRSHASRSLVSARVKSLLLYLSRILRPFWSCPIFQTLVVSGTITECFQSFPALYLVSKEQDFFSLKKLETRHPTSSNCAKLEEKLKSDPTSRKRKRVTTTTATLNNFTKKKSKSPQSNAVGKLDQILLENSSFLITTRFTQEEFSKTCDWLNRLSSVLERVISLTELENTHMYTTRDKDFGQPKRHPEISVLEKRYWWHEQPRTTQQTLTESDSVERPHSLYHTDLNFLRSLKKEIQLFSQYLSCCSYLLTEATESHALPKPIFRIFLRLSLSNMVIPSSEMQIVLKNILARHLVPPQILLERCPLLFNREELQFCNALHPLFTLHRIIMTQFQWKWELSYHDDALLEKTSILRSPGISKALEALLAIAAQPNRRVVLHIETMIVILVELQLFEYLADFIARVVEAILLEFEANKDNATSTIAPPQTELDSIVRPPHITSSCDSTTSYRYNPYFPLCYQTGYFAVDLILTKYYNLQTSQDNIQKNSCVLAKKFVISCLSLQPEIDPTLYDITQTPKHLSRTWLHYVVLDWMNQTGQRSFPIPLENAQTPVYPSWVNQQKSGLGLDSTKVLSKFFYSNGYYCQFAEFLLNLALKKWNDPAQMLSTTIDFPNRDAEVSNSEHAAETYLLCTLKNHTSLALASMSPLAPLEKIWTQCVNYIQVTSAGLTLEQRYTYLLEARDTLETRLSHFDKSHDISLQPYERDQRLRIPKDTVQSLRTTLSKVEHAIDLVMLQASLCREVIEICCFLWIKYGSTEDSLFFLAFSTDHSTRLNATQRLSQEHPNQYQYFHNVQSLLYLLRWRVYDSPLDLLQLIQEFADASKSLIPFPGMCFLSHPAFLRKEDLPLTDLPGSSTISRQSIISAAVFCRGFIAVELMSSSVLCDFISKFIFSIIEPRALKQKNSSIQFDKDFATIQALPISSSHTNELQINFFGEIILTLHEVAVVFQNKTSNGLFKEPPNPHPVCQNFSWTTHWWLWPSLVIQQQLNDVDNRISWDKERQLEGQQKLPFLCKLVGEYQKMMDTQFNTHRPFVSEQCDNSFRQPPSITHLNLTEYHYFVILLDLRQAWMDQLLGMASSLAYIHLLSTDFASQPSHLTTNLVPNISLATTASTNRNFPLYQPLKKNSTASPITEREPTSPLPHYLSQPHTIEQSSRQETFSDTAQIPTTLRNNTRGQNQLIMHLQSLYCKSPSRLQFYLERCQDLIQGSKQVLRLQKDWYAYYQDSIQKCLKPKSITTHIDQEQFILQELQISEKGFLTALDNLQQRIPTLQIYQFTIQHVLVQKTI